MRLPDLRYDYYNAAVIDATCGPRREVTVKPELMPLLEMAREQHGTGLEWAIQ